MLIVNFLVQSFLLCHVRPKVSHIGMNVELDIMISDFSLLCTTLNDSALSKSKIDSQFGANHGKKIILERQWMRSTHKMTFRKQLFFNM